MSTARDSILHNDEEKLSAEQRAAALAAFEEERRGELRKGRRLVYAIAGYYLLNTVVTMVFNFSLFNLLSRLALIVALLAGVRWVRYLFAAGMALGAALDFAALFSARGALSGLIVAALAVSVAINIAGCALLFFNKSVHEFLYDRKYG